MAILKKKTATLPMKKAGVAKSAPAKKTPMKKAASPKVASVPKEVIERNEWGIATSSDQARVLAQMIEGGVDKHSVIVRCDEMFNGEVTSGGKPKPSSTIMNQLIRGLTQRGFTVQASWKFIPPENGLTPAVKAVRTSAAKKVTAADHEAAAEAAGKAGTAAAKSALKKALGSKLPAKKVTATGPKKTTTKLPAKRSKTSS